MVNRSLWSHGAWFCWICGWHAGAQWPHPGCLPQLETHEVLRGPWRKIAVTKPSCWFRTCSYCHSMVLPTMPLERQLAYKMLCDFENYDLKEVLAIRNKKAVDYVQCSDVYSLACDLWKATPWFKDRCECRLPNKDELDGTETVVVW